MHDHKDLVRSLSELRAVSTAGAFRSFVLLLMSRSSQGHISTVQTQPGRMAGAGGCAGVLRRNSDQQRTLVAHATGGAAGGLLYAPQLAHSQAGPVPPQHHAARPLHLSVRPPSPPPTSPLPNTSDPSLQRAWNGMWDACALCSTLKTLAINCILNACDMSATNHFSVFLCLQCL